MTEPISKSVKKKCVASFVPNIYSFLRCLFKIQSFFQRWCQDQAGGVERAARWDTRRDVAAPAPLLQTPARSPNLAGDLMKSLSSTVFRGSRKRRRVAVSTNNFCEKLTLEVGRIVLYTLQSSQN